MKKFISVLLCVSFIMAVPFNTFADDEDTQTKSERETLAEEKFNQ